MPLKLTNFWAMWQTCSIFFGISVKCNKNFISLYEPLALIALSAL